MEVNVFISAVSGILSVPYFSNIAATFKIFWPIRSGTYTKKRIADTVDPVVVQGDVTVNSPPEESKRLFPNYNSEVGAYLWRISYDEAMYTIDTKNRTITPAKAGYESGIEFGDFSVTNREGIVKIDPAWLISTHNTILLSETTISTIPRTISFSPSMWSSPYIHLTSTETIHPLEEVIDLIGSKDAGEADQHYVESKPIENGTTLTVYGNVRIEDGAPIIHGTDAVPLAITDRGATEFRHYLTRRLIKNGVVASLLIIVFVFNWFII
ncbi:hypothetical protein V5735_03580 (plasmid) [Haladaptatus sp. SPP-AMP-3]|uniref:hypothetical protein n=1 Tax=Haladaptatus sp. SPP-AMP-3 TaxID=3121295 RepID=UPI003C2E09D2